MNATSLTDQWKRRLVAIVRTPDFVYRDTPATLIEEHRRGRTEFLGYSSDEIATAEATLGIRFPAVFRQYLQVFGRSRGELFVGSDLCSLDGFGVFRFDADRMLARTDPALRLTDDAVVFLWHQGYAFLWFRGIGGDDVPVLSWSDGDTAPEQVALTFAEFVDAQLSQMETVNRRRRELGGFYLTLSESGAVEHHPALASGHRPLDHHKPG